jgi:CRISPR-associated protein Csd1
VTILQALDRYYGRMAARGEAEAPGYSREKISFAVVLSANGQPVDKLDLRDFSGRKPQPRLMATPASVTRTAGVLPNLLWDKTAYALGVTAGTGKRTAEEHAAFKAANLELIGDDPTRAWLPCARSWRLGIPRASPIRRSSSRCSTPTSSSASTAL